jgi:hypothetical protein
LNLIDRINVHYKLGAHVVVSFSDAERNFLREIDNAETWEQVEDIAKRVYGYVKDSEPTKIKSMDDLDEAMQPESGEDSGESEDYDNSNDSGDWDDSNQFEAASESNEDAEESDSAEESGEESENSEDSGDIDGEPRSVTDRIFRSKEKELINESGLVQIFNLPEVDLSKAILNNNVVMNDLESFIKKQVADTYLPYGKNGISYDTVIQKCVGKFNKNNKKYIMHLLKEFEMRKKATQYARTTTARTGELNMNVLHKYKFSNDLFRKIDVVPKGKSHGLIMYVDMSGSMYNLMRNTIEQSLVLASFCKLANIPFDVYGFSDDWYSSLGQSNRAIFNSPDTTYGVINGGSFHLKHLIGSSLNSIQYRKSFNMLAVIINEYNRKDYDSFGKNHGNFSRWDDAGFGLNGTPFVPTLVASIEMIRKFQSEKKLDIVNVLYLTDGEGGNGMNYPYDPSISYYDSRKIVTYLVEKKTGKKVRVENGDQQTAVTKLVAAATGCKHIGFYLADNSFIKYKLNGAVASMNPEDAKKIKNSYRDEKFFATSALGYHRYFYVLSSEQNITDATLGDVRGLTKTGITNAFKKMQQGKKTSRILVSKFAEEIATAI